MRVLFLMRHSGYVRNFESTLQAMSRRGDLVHLAFQANKRYEWLDPTHATDELIAANPGLSTGLIPRVVDEPWITFANRMRQARDYLRYLEPEYGQASKLRLRQERRASPRIIRVGGAAAKVPGGLAALHLGLRAVITATPRSAAVDAYLREQAPDVLLVTPLVDSGSPQAEFVRSARALGIRTALCVASWDNLTNKGLIHETPDLVTVWNAAMRREAVELHGVPPERVVVTGAPAYDQWFDWAPSTTRAEFGQRVGLPTDQPLLLYVCSSKFIAPDEVPFVRHWLQQLRAHPDACLRSVGVLIRPHPQNAAQWRTADLADLGPAVVWPLDGANPVDASAKADYFDSIFHAAAVIGINTSALIESAIVGRPVHTLLAPEFHETQEGTLHFHHLVREAGGMLRVAATFDEHTAQLQQALADATTPHASALNAAFLEAFVRPYGLHEPATPRLVAAIEALAAQPAPAPTRDPLWAPPVRVGLQRFVTPTKPEAPQSRAEPENRSGPAASEALARTFGNLSESDRMRFLRAALPAFPPAFWLKSNRPWARRERLDYANADIDIIVTSKREHLRTQSCAKEPWTVRWIEEFVKPGDVLYDIGANIGAYSLIAGKWSRGEARILAIEPSFANFASLCENVVLNGLTDTITPLPIGLSSRTGVQLFDYTGLSAGEARHMLQETSAGTPFTPVYTQQIITFRLDDLIEQFHLPSPQHIKLDVDGAECEVLEGARQTLELPNLKSLMVEVFVDQTDKVIQFLSERGLDLHEKFERPNRKGELQVWYGLFSRATQA